ncbi:hypothetical protein M422DRAFT_29439 [Sphaerobolus stellatus SS14]|uniref:Unplaced genomic scaffold SPHSTscaffold_34, whole genome shotgun sequence n=1 Tax=Sphaerobolus stellatus (strain SS14) TaxID=990650 RepID=A0A0C9UT43_SPHS4|nr:hypothetical protein M422DRAFT_29439 [Sphaerobolus stellatus SS14]
MRTTVISLVSLSAYVSAVALQQRNSAMSMTLPIKKRNGQPLRRDLARRKAFAVGLGDDADLQYSVEMSLGGVNVPIVLDTGSSDLWAISSDCTKTSCGEISGLPVIKTSEFKPAGLDFRIDYGDSNEPSFAAGVTLSGTVSLAGTQLDNQFIGAVNDTNTLTDGLTGVFGVGFHTISAIESSLLTQDGASASTFTDTLNAQIAAQGPFLTRLILNGQLDQPLFTITLQRETVQVGGNIGQITIGKLPDGVSNDSLTWVPVRLYSEDQGGLPPPTGSNERYPLFWEVPIDDVIVNGQTLPKPNINASIGYTALIDSGTSSLLGPQNTVEALYSALSTGTANFNANQGPKFDCTQPVALTYVIGGKQFPVDPRDFLGPVDITDCTISQVGPTDPPSPGSLLSWILGDPFMKSNLVAFYFGNVTHPSVDPPRIGFLSTVPSNAAALYSSAISSAQKTGGIIFATQNPPTGTFAPAATNSAGVGQAPSPSAGSSSTGSKSSASKFEFPSLLFILVALAMFSL